MIILFIKYYLLKKVIPKIQITVVRKMTKSIEIMAPAGSYESLMAAINAGTHSVYLGVEQLNMRARAANNFTMQDLTKIIKICRKNNVKACLALNTVMYDHDLRLMRRICDTAKKSGLTAVILSDIAALQYARSIGLEVHMSTQTNITNIEAVKFYAQFADVMVLARELTLKQIAVICNKIKKENIIGPSGNLVKIEIFVHGALCVAISGKCYMSLAVYNASANRGACLQNCRRSYIIKDEETGDELKIDNKYIMSPKDLCTIGFIDKLIEAGVSVFKIEGRGRSPEYVDVTVNCYREAAESYFAGSYTQEKIDSWTKRLETVFNRGFWHGGYYLGKKLGEWSGSYGSQSTIEKIYVGRVRNYFQKAKVGYIKLETGGISTDQEILITGPTTGVIQQKVRSMFLNNKKITEARKGDNITLHIKEKIRPNDKIYVLNNITKK